ncbi:MAG: GatB/YqeY domain-containing protein [Candidatus Omnitrophica bacterium]|nr:GatB/YqeY domain-containing protein [Candidatus Omnitrophota bacterium]
MLHEQINQDYVTAMKARDTVKSSTLNFLRAQLKNVGIDKKVTVLDDESVTIVIKKQIKQRQDSIEQFEKAGRQELADKEIAEMTILKSYLPTELSEEALKILIKDVIKEIGASSIKDMGRVIKAVQEKTKGSADNKVVSEIVKAVLMNS